MYILFHSSSSSSFTFFFFFFFFSVDCKESIYEDYTKYLKEKKKTRWTRKYLCYGRLFWFLSFSLSLFLFLLLLWSFLCCCSYFLFFKIQRILASRTVHPIVSVIFSIIHTYDRFLFGLFGFGCWRFWRILLSYLFKLPFLRGGWNRRITGWIINSHFTVERNNFN